VIIGSNGCGKSTLLKTLARLIKPTSGTTTFLDITYQVEILDLLTDLNHKHGTTIVMVLHDINLSARYADHIFALNKGKLLAEG